MTEPPASLFVPGSEPKNGSCCKRGRDQLNRGEGDVLPSDHFHSVTID